MQYRYKEPSAALCHLSLPPAPQELHCPEPTISLGLTRMNQSHPSWSLLGGKTWLQLDYARCEGALFPVIVSLGLVWIPVLVSVPWTVAAAACSRAGCQQRLQFFIALVISGVQISRNLRIPCSCKGVRETEGLLLLF